MNRYEYHRHHHCENMFLNSGICLFIVSYKRYTTNINGTTPQPLRFNRAWSITIIRSFIGGNDWVNKKSVNKHIFAFAMNFIRLIYLNMQN